MGEYCSVFAKIIAVLLALAYDTWEIFGGGKFW